MWFGVISLFPEMFATLDKGVTGRALKEGLISLQLWNPRNFAEDKHHTVDDRPYGGGPGMVMQAQPLLKAIKTAKSAAKTPPTVIYLSPQGRHFDQQAAIPLAEQKSLLFVAGRYEGIDERVIAEEIDEEWSIGDYILTGGELAAMVMIDAITRLIPGVIGDEDSVKQDSLTSGLLKYPQYTRPELLESHAVPPVLLSGNHAAINEWRLKASLGKTWLRRPDLLAKKGLTAQELTLLQAFIQEFLQNKAK